MRACFWIHFSKKRNHFITQKIWFILCHAFISLNLSEPFLANDKRSSAKKKVLTLKVLMRLKLITEAFFWGKKKTNNKKNKTLPFKSSVCLICLRCIKCTSMYTKSVYFPNKGRCFNRAQQKDAPLFLDTDLSEAFKSNRSTWQNLRNVDKSSLETVSSSIVLCGRKRQSAAQFPSFFNIWKL